jgi:hypothetical protein
MTDWYLLAFLKIASIISFCELNFLLSDHTDVYEYCEPVEQTLFLVKAWKSTSEFIRETLKTIKTIFELISSIAIIIIYFINVPFSYNIYMWLLWNI